MQDAANRRGGRRQGAGRGASAADETIGTAEQSIRQAYVARLDKRLDQQGGAFAGDKPAEARRRDAELAETVREQQHTGNHDKPGPEAHGSDRRGGTRAGAGNVEPPKR